MMSPIRLAQIICFVVIGFCVSVTQAAVFKAVQSGVHTHTTTNGTQTTAVALATSIDPSKSYLMFQSSHDSSDPGGSMIRGRILDANTLQFESVYDRSSTINIQWYVVEYTSGVSVQRGVVSQSSTTINVALPTAVSAVNQAFVTWSKTALGSDSSWSGDDPIVGQITSTSNLQFRVNQANPSHVIWWQVVEYTDAADISVQTVSSSMTGNQRNRNVGISGVDTSKSFILSSFRTSGSGNDIDERMISATFSSGSNVRIRRNGSGDNLNEVLIQVVQLNDGTVVQGNETRLRNGDTSATAGISAVTLANSIAFASVQAVGGQNMGRVDYSANDIIGEGSVRLSLSSTQLTLNRDRSSDDAYIGWFVLDYSAVPSTSPPTILSASGSCVALTTVTVLFSEALEQSSAETVGNYSVVNPSGGSIGINSATRSAPDTVTLALSSSLNDLTDYTVSVSNVQDLDGDTIVAGSSISFTLACDLNCIGDSFAGPGPLNADWSVDNTSGSFGDPRIVTNGRLRLTDASRNVATVATLLNQFPGADNKIEIEFDYYAYNGSGADGIAVTFSDASITPVPGGYGGSLGYAQRSNSGGIAGFAGGWLGIGIDEYGNFSNPTEGRQGGTGFARDSVALRGSGSGTSGYPFLTGTGTLSPGVDQSGSTPNPGHRYRITIDHTMGGSEAWTKVERDTGSGYVEIVPNFDIFAVNPSQAAVPDNWVVSFTGSTGGATNIHEIADLQVCAAQPISTYGSPDHYAIAHSSPGITCEGSQVTVTAHDASHSVFNVTGNTDLTVTTSPAVDSIISSPATILAGASSTSFYLNQSSVLNNIDIDVSDGIATDPDDGGAEDAPFNFLDTAFRFYANGSNTVTTPIGTQISGKPSSTAPGAQSLSLRAVRTNTDTGACEAALTGVQTVDIAYECNNPGNCSGSNLLELTATGPGSTTVTRNNNGAPLSYASVNMTFDSAGEAPFSFNFSDAGQVTLYAQKTVAASSPDPAFTLAGSSNAFVTRPFGFDLDLNDANSFAADSSGSGFIASGENFTMSVEAILWAVADDADYDGIPDVGADLTNNTLVANFGNEASAQIIRFSHTLKDPDPSVGNMGVLTAPDILSSDNSATLSWDEVGIIDITSKMDNYLGDTNADVTTSAANVGRFYPAQFLVSDGSGAFANSCSSSFTYIGQNFSYNSAPTISITAQNSSGGTTQNYTQGGFQKVLPADVEIVYPTTDDTKAGALSGEVDVVATRGGDGSFSASNAGVITYQFASDTYTYTKNQNSIVTKFTPEITSEISGVTDDDGVSMVNLTNPQVSVVGGEARYGRWNMLNAFGPETQNLAMPARAEYLDASGDYVINTDDNCSNISGTVTTLPVGSGSGPITGISVGSGTSDLSFSNTLSSGDAQYLFTFPGSGNTGSIAVDVDLSALLWLQYDWDGDGSLENSHPGASATFGQYRGHDRIIYWREVSN